MAIQTFGETLYCPESGYLEEFPSVESLKHKIILSTKPPKEYLGSNHSKEGETSSPKDKDFSDDEPETESEADDKVTKMKKGFFFVMRTIMVLK